MSIETFAINRYNSGINGYGRNYMKQEFYYKSADNITQVHVIKWVPEGKIRGILQVSHGMLEHIERYDEFASFMSANGILVAGNDHLGHGSSLISEQNRGFFSENEGNKTILSDIHNLRCLLREEYKEIPYFLLGHSMGSFLVRQYITLYGKSIDGVIIVGTGQQPYALVKMGLMLTKLISLFKGNRYRSKLVNYLAIGSYNNHFKPNRTAVDWLSRDEKVVDAYIRDKRIDFIFTLNAYTNMFAGMLELYDSKKLDKIPKDLPVLFLSGEKDPVGNFGKDIVKVYQQYKKVGILDVSYKLYKENRHEILNEFDKEIVYNEIIKWVIDRREENK